MVQMRVTYLSGDKCKRHVHYQNMLWMGFEEGAARRYEFQDTNNISVFCVEPGFGIPLKVRWIRTKAGQPCERETAICQQIWTRQARRAGVALYLALRRRLKLDHSLCRVTARWVAGSYMNSGWEPARGDGN